ncbi:hypothetical protein [Streptomyces sp. NBC_01294]|uniref:hypothetical protein n=1 Tax=Streptomyces sp. NBC_01294 TaxID=2903815 RepID=UPI002DDC4CA5|nr:hypothetical protein [Streptomyces sp. NBC_01294]WRZ61666.1 hypothetical protein OG534_01415 [Streptomyces sp. NBC_01294]WRZ62141.1 hypothetical protein OG534_36085 [Streptomyces sp. NBC_01294]
MRAGAAVKRVTGGWGLVAVLIAAAVVTSGCAGSVDPDELPGVYRNDKTGGEILLDADGTFSATDISEGEVTGWGSADPVDFSGQWDFTRSNFVYLEADDGELDVDVQLYMAGPKKVYLRPDPDGPVTLKLTKAAAP